MLSREKCTRVNIFTASTDAVVALSSFRNRGRLDRIGEARFRIDLARGSKTRESHVSRTDLSASENYSRISSFPRRGNDEERESRCRGNDAFYYRARDSDARKRERADREARRGRLAFGGINQL